MSTSDKKLIEMFIEGDTDAQKTFIKKYKSWVVGIALKRFKMNVFSAEEIFQIVMLNLIDNDYRVLRSWQGKGKFSTYLTIIIIRICSKYV